MTSVVIMIEAKKPFIIIVSGPNGAGKTTFYNSIISQNVYLSDAVFLNCDNEIAELKKLPEFSKKYQDIISAQQAYIYDLKPATHVVKPGPFIYSVGRFHSFAEQFSRLNVRISRIATQNMRQKIKNAFAGMKHIVFETTSTAGRMKKLAQQHGYEIYGCHICVFEPELSVARVQQRVKKGGHDIPEQIIYQRYAENIRTLSNVMRTETSAIVIDNSGKVPFTPVFGLSEDCIIDITDCPEYLQSTYNCLVGIYQQKSLKEIMNLEDDIDVKMLSAGQRKTFIQIMLLNMLGKVTCQK